MFRGSDDDDLPFHPSTIPWCFKNLDRGSAAAKKGKGSTKAEFGDPTSAAQR